MTMKKISIVLLLLMNAVCMVKAQQPAKPAPMVLTTTAFADGTVIPLKYTRHRPVAPFPRI